MESTKKLNGMYGISKKEKKPLEIEYMKWEFKANT
jgi:hypothetical protein